MARAGPPALADDLVLPDPARIGTANPSERATPRCEQPAGLREGLAANVRHDAPRLGRRSHRRRRWRRRSYRRWWWRRRRRRRRSSLNHKDAVGFVEGEPRRDSESLDADAVGRSRSVRDRPRLARRVRGRRRIDPRRRGALEVRCEDGVDPGGILADGDERILLVDPHELVRTRRKRDRHIAGEAPGGIPGGRAHRNPIDVEREEVKAELRAHAPREEHAPGAANVDDSMQLRAPAVADHARPG